ncbi:MAG: hypothetical protein P1V18_00065 [Candidatus Gracilibacteria bacterium]|nr:hypothetical protein [Candidatus Gracilibacteria bacterium]
MKSPVEQLSNMLSICINCANITLEIIVHRELDKNYLMKSLGLEESVFENSMNELLEKDVIVSFENDQNITLYKVAHLLDIKKRISADSDTYQTLKGVIFPDLATNGKISLLKYEGWEGIRQVYLEVLSEAIQSGEEILAFEEILNKVESGIGAEFLGNYLNRRIENKVMAKVITTDTASAREYAIGRNESFTDVQIAADLSLSGTINIVGDLIMSYSMKPLQGTLLRDHSQANNLKNIFNLVWNASGTA